MNDPHESSPSDLRTLKRRALRQEISYVATRLFLERGFDSVTVDDIAAAAQVGRMTVFNHFPRKEDMFFDREGEVVTDAHHALQYRDPGVTPLEALRLLAHRLVADHRRYLEFSAASQRFVQAILASETLKARARAFRDELAQGVAEALAESVGRQPTDPIAHLGAGMLLGVWTVALAQAHLTFAKTRDPAKATATFLALVDQGTLGVRAALGGSGYG